MSSQLRIIAGVLKGRKLTCSVTRDLRPAPDMVRQALFSILGNAIPGRPFFDVFAGTGIVGMEAISRGAASATFVERDFRRIAEIDRHLTKFEIQKVASIVKADAYRWAERWLPPDEPVNVFVGPPFADYSNRPEDLIAFIGALQNRVPPESIVVLQTDRDQPFVALPTSHHQWEERKYGRNILQIWVKESASLPDNTENQPSEPGIPAP